ncbi:hypothetical protein EBB07_04945 [Paenibacillaceae bacterium]|nr:hypothetical protein EBB07_04945 [Paenibacillaceae bacterium]
MSVQSKTPGAIAPDAYAEYVRCYRNPACVHAVCEDYRATVTIDVAIEDEQKGMKAVQPLLALWGDKGTVGKLFNVIGLWRNVQPMSAATPCLAATLFRKKIRKGSFKHYTASCAASWGEQPHAHSIFVPNSCV